MLGAEQRTADLSGTDGLMLAFGKVLAEVAAETGGPQRSAGPNIRVTVAMDAAETPREVPPIAM